MSCTITYKGKKYSEEQFKEYFISNKNEFATSISKNKDVIDSFKRKMEAIDGVFKDSPELASIGTKTQYMQYLSTIFKTSKVKDIVYHVSEIEGIEEFKTKNLNKRGGTKFFEAFSNNSTLDGAFFTNELSKAKFLYGTGVTTNYDVEFDEETGEMFEKEVYFKNPEYVYTVLLNIKNPYKGTRKNTNNEKIKNYDSALLEAKEAVEYIQNSGKIDFIEYTEYVVFEPEQIHILGSKQDIEGFKDFVKESSKPKVSQITDEYGNTWNEVEIKSEFKQKIYLNLSNQLSKLPNNQWFNRTIQPIINRFSKMFPNVRSVVISEKEIPSEVKSIVDKLDKQINSFFHKGQVYIIKERVTKDIAIEEFLHPFINALEQDNPELYKSLLLEAKKLFPELKEEVFTKYGKVYSSIFDLNREFLTQALTKKVSEQTPEQETFFQKFKSWIRNILDRLFGNEATTREISMLDETMSLTDLASILNENNTQFNFNSDTNTTYYSLNEEEITNYLNRSKTPIQAQILDKILENNKVTQTDFTGGRHEYTRNELGEILQLKPVSSFLSKKINPELDFSDFAQIGNAIHEIVKNINLNLLPRTQLIDAYAEKSDLKRILVDEKGYPIEAVKQILSNIYDYVTPLIGSKESLLVSEVSISALQDLGEYKGVAGTIDLLEITKNGDLIIHDFKSMYLNGLETYVYTNNPSTQLTNKFNDNEKAYIEQLSLYAKMLKGIVGNKNITLQIVPIGYLATSETKDNVRKVFFSDELVKNNASLMVENYIYSPFNLINVSKQQVKFQVNYNKPFTDKILPSIKDVEEKKLSKEEIDRQELLDNLTNKIKSENSKSFEAEIEKVFKQVTTIVTQYGNSQNELNQELFKIFDPKGELKETKANFEAIFETIKEMGEDNPEKLKHYLSTLVQYINYIEETNVGLSNIKSHFYKIVANDAKLDNQTLISDMRRSYLLAKSHEKGINSILGQLGDIKEDNGFKQLLRNSISYVAEIENLYFKKSLPLIANVLNSYFGKEFRDSMSKEIQDRLNKEKYDLNLATSDNAKIRINNKILKLEEQLKMIPNPNLIADIIQGKYGDSDWFYSNLMANINNPDYVISGTESFMTDIMRDLSLIAIKQEEEFARQFSKREDTLKVNRDQVKEMNKDLVYASNHLVKKADGTTEVLKSMTLLTEVNEDVYFDYEVLQDQLLKTEPNSPERKVIADKIKQFENEHFESEFNPRYLKALSAIDVVVSDGRNVKQVRQAILDKIKAIKVSNYKLNYLQGELESEDDLVELRELWREFMNLSSTIDRNGNKKTGADLEIADILQARKKELEEFRDKKVDEDLWKKLKAKKIQSLLGKYNTEEEVLKSEEYKKWQSFNSVISPTEEFYELRQSKLNAINLILDKKEYKDIALVGQLKDNLNQSWEKLNALSREYRDFEREFISQDIPEGSKIAMKILEENIDKVKTQIKGLEKSLSKEDKKSLNNLWEDYNSMVEYKTSKYYEEDLEIALNKYALENDIEVGELRNDKALMTQFRLNSEWYINSHITKERYDKASGETFKYTEPVYYYKTIVPTNPDYIKERPAFQYSTFDLKPEAYNLDENGNPIIPSDDEIDENASCIKTPSGLLCPAVENCSPFDLSESTETCIINDYVAESINIGGAPLNVYRLLGVHEQGSLQDLVGAGTSFSNGFLPGYSSANAFDKYVTEYRSLQTGEDVVKSAFLGYDFGPIKLSNGRTRYGIETAIKFDVSRIQILQGCDSGNRVTKIRIERSNDGEKWFGVAIQNLPDCDGMVTLNFARSVPSRYWRIRPVTFNGGPDDYWSIKALQFIDYEKTKINNIQDRILLENRDRDYDENPIKMKCAYQPIDTIGNQTKFGFMPGSDKWVLEVSFTSAIQMLGRPFVIGDIIELPSETQYSANLTPTKKYLEVEDTGWSVNGYTPTWVPTLMRLIAVPAISSQETQDLFGKLTRDVDSSGLVDIDNGQNDVYQDYSDISQTIKADSRARKFCNNFNSLVGSIH